MDPIRLNALNLQTLLPHLQGLLLYVTSSSRLTTKTPWKKAKPAVLASEDKVEDLQQEEPPAKSLPVSQSVSKEDSVPVSSKVTLPPEPEKPTEPIPQPESCTEDSNAIEAQHALVLKMRDEISIKESYINSLKDQKSHIEAMIAKAETDREELKQKLVTEEELLASQQNKKKQIEETKRIREEEQKKKAEEVKKKYLREQEEKRNEGRGEKETGARRCS